MANRYTFERKKTLSQFNINTGQVFKSIPTVNVNDLRAVIYCRVSSSKQVAD